MRYKGTLTPNQKLITFYNVHYTLSREYSLDMPYVLSKNTSFVPTKALICFTTMHYLIMIKALHCMCIKMDV